jgi:putative sigma-54 modulation protein
MKLVMNFVGLDKDARLEGFIQERANKLETFYDRIQHGEVYVKKMKDTDADDSKVVEIKLFLPGDSLFSKVAAKTFEEATDNVVEGLRRQLKKYKEKLQVKQGIAPLQKPI